MMARQDANQAFAATSFLYGANAPYLEEIHQRYVRDPNTVDAEWRQFFEGLRDSADRVMAEARGAPWQRKNWPPLMNGELVAALDGNWGEAIATKVTAGAGARGQELTDGQVQQATRDSIHAIMMIRAYRAR